MHKSILPLTHWPFFQSFLDLENQKIHLSLIHLYQKSLLYTQIFDEDIVSSLGFLFHLI